MCGHYNDETKMEIYKFRVSGGENACLYTRGRLPVRRVLPAAAPAVAARVCGRGLGLEAELGAQRHDPLVLEQLDGGGALVGIAIEAFDEEVDALLAELVAGGELRRVALRDVVHDGPFVVHRGPGAAASGHF